MTEENKILNVVDISEKLFGVKTTYRINPLVAVLGTVTTRILRLNPKRMAFVLVNLSIRPIYISPNNDVSATNGIILTPNGGAMTVKFNEDIELQTLEWYGVGPVNNLAIFLIETYIV